MRINVAIDPPPCGNRAGAETAEWVKMAENETPLEMCEPAEAEVRLPDRKPYLKCWHDISIKAPPRRRRIGTL